MKVHNYFITIIIDGILVTACYDLVVIAIICTYYTHQDTQYV